MNEPKHTTATSPSRKFNLKPYLDGNKWCVLLGANLAEGTAGFGNTEDEAMADFDRCWILQTAAPRMIERLEALVKAWEIDPPSMWRFSRLGVEMSKTRTLIAQIKGES